MAKKEKKKFSKGEMVIYRPKGEKGEVVIRVKLEKDTVWLDARQMAQIFGIDRTVIVKHVNNIYKTKELNVNSTCAKIAQVAADGKARKINLYNLDMIISVGYRVNSQRATQFRIWTTKILKSYLLQGFAINERRLQEANAKFNQLKETVAFLQKKSKTEMLAGQEQEILNLLADYSKTLTLLEKYDKNKLAGVKGVKGKFKLAYNDGALIVNQLKKELTEKKEASDFFGLEVDQKFESIIKNLYQTFGGKELYRTVEDKAAHLLYLTIKDHPFTDGNKRVASFLFVYFLDKNGWLYRASGEKKINDNALTALALLIAESDPQEKEQMIALVAQLIG